jgi:formamidopyrimidine-DNA glycosylase
MPELPEVETIRAGLEPALAGRSIVGAIILDPRLTAPDSPERVAQALVGERVDHVRRRGKYVVVAFASGRHLLVHLRMTGSFRLGGSGPLEDDPHRRAVVSLDDGSDVTFRDVRRFGTWLLLEPEEEIPYLLARLGEEPLGEGFTRAALAARLRGRRAPIKAALLDQRAAAGLGNIYADEALWGAKIHPLRPAGSLTAREIGSLNRAIKDALRAGIARQGTTLRNYRTPNGAPGSMQDELRVYGREGEPCPRCRAPITKTRAGGRGTWFCPRCQRETP